MLSDYGYGLLNQSLIERIIEKASAFDIPVVVDSRNQLRKFKNATIATPNLEEASQFWGSPIRTENDLEEAGNYILKRVK